MKWSVLISLIYFLSDVEGLKVLICFPLPVKSLSILGQGAVRHLMEAGHDVTYITVYPLKIKAKNFRQIDISTNTALVASDESLTMEYILNHKLERNPPNQVQEFAVEALKMTLNHENVKKLLEDPNEHFDVIITDLIESEVYAGLAVLYNCPMVWLYSMGAHWQVLRLIDVASNPAYDPDYLSPNMPPLTFTQRAEELWSRIYWQYLKTFYTQPEERSIYEEVFGPLLAKRGRPLPDYEDVMYNASLIFANEHDATRNRASTPQNFKYIGGFHIEEPVKPLPKDLQDLIDNSKHGVIYFSMGSVLKSNSMPRKLVMDLLQMFGEFKQTVIWKFEDNSLQGVPKNVHIVNWAPQPSILAHPNVKMFISHGGQLSSLEAIHFGKPIIGIPVFFDQFTNIHKAAQNGYALRVPLSQNLPRDLKPAINTMLSDDRYAKQVKELSDLYHDRLTKPGPALVYWVEHVVRTRGALHLRSPALHVPLYQRLYLDLLAIILIITFSIIFLLIRLCNNKNGKRNDKKKSN
ncbi:UDP-glucuronosyltransferase 2B10-like [Spodoptera litura]|uniref:UDP-glucuronosyltransferase 2B10-like n=1 Tax=Spodoptera litura TaxID=69820 RepID=A0A9J7ILS9_SPOLT|nr:UDP-glucuronosyltransferase 2B10-like [Spodoptera litura]